MEQVLGDKGEIRMKYVKLADVVGCMNEAFEEIVESNDIDKVKNVYVDAMGRISELEYVSKHAEVNDVENALYDMYRLIEDKYIPRKEVAKACGISVSTLYSYFDGKTMIPLDVYFKMLKYVRDRKPGKPKTNKCTMSREQRAKHEEEKRKKREQRK